MSITASDQDHGRNAEVTYTLLEENDWEQFDIGAKSGDLVFRNKLDRETKSSYEVRKLTLKVQSQLQQITFSIFFFFLYFRILDMRNFLIYIFLFLPKIIRAPVSENVPSDSAPSKDCSACTSVQSYQSVSHM